MYTAEQFSQAMRDAVAKRGEDYIYNKKMPGWNAWDGDGNFCVYQTPEGEPACIIGVALDLLGAPLPPNNQVVSASEVLGELGFPSSIFRAADNAQAAQDRGETWGIALARYEETVN